MDLSVPCFMKACLDSYEALRGKVPKEVGATFWDAVVISAADEDQACAFRIQIDDRKRRSLIPVVPYHVFPDPPGPKIGSGGATLHILEHLQGIYGEEQARMRILLIHTGGQSKRLPSHSVLGKLFALLPVAAAAEFQMFDLKMAMYSPFLSRMKAGVFLTCSDDIETYTLPTSGHGDASQWSFDRSGFTALAHPSPVRLGLTHGVYVVPENVHCTTECLTTECLEVLQKPTEKAMRDKGAIFEQEEGGIRKELTYTDSAFFFDNSVSLKLLHFYKDIKPVTEEIDAYRDFLQLLGCRSKSCMLKTQWGESGDQPKVQHILRDCELQVLVLPLSRFYHLGTMREYVDNICLSETFAKELHVSRFVHSRLVPAEPPVPDSRISGVVMHSLVHQQSTIPFSAVLEYCKFERPVQIGDNCILSNCRLEGLGDNCIQVPGNLIMFTVTVSGATCKGYVTVTFGIDDDLKLSVRDEGELCYFGQELVRLKERNIIGSGSLFTSSASLKSLWEAKLFSVKPTMTEAFLSTLEMVQAVLKGTQRTARQESGTNVSMEDILRWKDINEILKHQSTVFS